MDLSYLGAILPGLVSIWLWLKYVRRHRNSLGLPHPPGPKGLPIIGNVLDMPPSHEWLKAAEWRKTYGDMVFVQNLGKPAVFINSYEVAVDLLEKRSLIYSSRPESIMFLELQRWDWLISNMPYGEKWMKNRACLRQFLEPASIAKYSDLQDREAHRMLSNLHSAPKDFIQHVRGFIGATIMMMTYGYEAKSRNDPYISLAERAIGAVAEAAIPYAFLVEIIPWLKYVPSWFPGAGFQRVAEKGRKLSNDVRYKPYYEMKAKVLDGTAHQSMMSELIEENMDENGRIYDEETIANATAMVYIAGADTSVSTILTFILAMVLNPDVQRRAQEEIDSVIGRGRLPTLKDKPNLPYVNALCIECLRWQPVTPLGASRRLTEDDVYNGYFLPKGTIIIPNQWLFLHDPEVYPDPDAFKPERHLSTYQGGPDTKLSRDPRKIAFGFGRRVCPGKHVATSAVFTAVSSILASFNIQKTIGKDGMPITPKIEYISGLVSHPAPFECSFVPRSERSAALVRQALES
ncbi:hypothetical protein M0805_006950 [Coniferiporia weirii]|nr:hypothetical protein M0805_006950 [Coniferiporia weirii]